MKKRDFFIAAIRNDEYRRKEWVISAFAVTSSNLIQLANKAASVNETPYPYKIIQTPTGIFFLDPNNEMNPTRIEDAEVGKPLFGIKEKVSFKKDDFVNLDKDINTTYGQALWNSVILIYPFKDKIKYLQGRITVNQVEAIINPKLKDTPEENEIKDDKFFYVDELIVFADAVKYIEQFTQLCVPAATKRTMLPAPGIEEFRNKLLEQNKDKLHDPAVIATIDAELVKYDKEAMKGDLAEGFLINGKSWNVVRKKLFGMYGSEAGFTDGVEVENIGRSLSEGWDTSKFPILNNASRAGSFNRGAETQLGGEAVKWLLRASSNLRVKDKDCGTKLGKPMNVAENNYYRLVGFYYLDKDSKPVFVQDFETAKSLIGKRLLVRSPMYCKHDQTDYCATCVGSRLNEHPTALSMAVSAYGSEFMNIFMKAMHGKQLALAKMDYKTAIS